MGEAKKNSFEHEKRWAMRKSIPARALKGLVGFIISPFVWLVLLPFECFRRDKWPWEL